MDKIGHEIKVSDEIRKEDKKCDLAVILPSGKQKTLGLGEAMQFFMAMDKKSIWRSTCESFFFAQFRLNN